METFFNHLALQIWGGGFYTLNKFFLSKSERTVGDKRRLWRIWSWIVYIVGVPAWAIIFIIERDWIATALQFGGTPSLFLGLAIAVRGKGETPKWLDRIAITTVAIGLCISVYDFGGINTLSQTLELLIVTSSLLGVYLIAKESASGYLWFLLTHTSSLALLGMQGYWILALQQIISFAFIFDAYRNQKRRLKL